MTPQASSTASGAEYQSHAGADVESALTVARLRERMFGISTKTTFGAHGRYIILDRRGTGGMANVYKATDTQLDIPVALKLLRTDPWQSGGPLASASQRLLDEAQKLASTTSAQHIARVYNVDTCDGVHYIAMEYIDGPNLRRWQTAAGRTQGEIIAAYLDAGRGLSELHQLGLVHLDFKPENVMIEEQASARKPTRTRPERSWRAVLVDLGLAMRIDGNRTEYPEEQSSVSGESLGYSMYVVGGTPAYTAPERLLRRSFGRASDQFSFCVAFYEALFRSHPLAGMPPLDEYISTLRTDKPQLAESTLRLKYVHDVQQAIRRGRRLAPPRDLRLPWGLLAALERGMDPDPAKRFKSMDDLLDALTRTARLRGQLVPVFLPIAASLVALFSGGLVYQQSRQCSGFDERIASVWNPDIAGRVAERFVGAPIARTVAEAFDDFAGRWQADSEAVCQAHRSGHESDHAFDNRQSCMARALRIAASTVDGLMAGTGTTTVNTVQLAVLGDLLTACASEDPDELPMPSTPEAAVVLAELEAVSAKEVRNELPEARVQAAALLQKAEALGIPAVTAEVAHRLGRILGQLRNNPGQDPDILEQTGWVLERARDQAAAAHRRRLTLDAWLFDLKVRADTITSAASINVRLPGGHVRLADAWIIADQFGSDAQRAQALEAQGLYWLRGKTPLLAMESFARAMQLRRDVSQRLGADPTRRFEETVALAKNLANLGAAALQAARVEGSDRDTLLDAATAHYNEAIARWIEVAGRQSLYTLRARMNLALVLGERDADAAGAELEAVQRDLTDLAKQDPNTRTRGAAEWNAMHLHLAKRAFQADDLSACAGHIAALRQGPLTPQQDMMTTLVEADLCAARRDWACAIQSADAVIERGESLGDTTNVAAAKVLRATALKNRDAIAPDDGTVP